MTLFVFAIDSGPRAVEMLPRARFSVLLSPLLRSPHGTALGL